MKNRLIITVFYLVLNSPHLSGQSFWVYDTAVWGPTHLPTAVGTIDVASCNYLDTMGTYAFYFRGLTMLSEEEIFIVGTHRLSLSSDPLRDGVYRINLAAASQSAFFRANIPLYHFQNPFYKANYF